MKNKYIANKTLYSLTFPLWGILFLCGIALHHTTLPAAEATEVELLQQVLTLELPEAQFTQWENGKEGIILRFVRKNEHNQIYLYELIERDLNSDGIPEIIIACKFMDKWRLGDEDFLVVYTIDKDNLLKRYFRKSFQQTGRGDFLDVQVKDITGNGSLDISITYIFANARMHLWEAEDYFYIIRERSPFDTLLELQTRDGRGGDYDNIDDEHLMTRELEMNDIDGDGINEILVSQYEGKDSQTLKKITREPLFYRASFQLITHSFEHLRKKGLPEEIIQGLQPLEEQEFAMKGDFLQAVKKHLGEEGTEKYETLLVQYTIYRYQLEGE